MHVEQLFFAVVRRQVRYFLYKNRPSVTEGRKTKQADVQIPNSSTSNR